MITLTDALDGISSARDYWDLQWVAAFTFNDQDRMDAAMSEKRALTRLAIRLIHPDADLI